MADLPDGQLPVWNPGTGEYEPVAANEILDLAFDPLNEDHMKERGFIKEPTQDGGYVWKLANSSFRHLENIIERNKAREAGSSN